MEREVTRALREVEQAVASRLPYEQALSALEACTDLPGAEEVAIAIASWRVTLASHYGRPVQECEAALIRFLALSPPLHARASTLLAECAQHPEVADRYLESIIDELEESSSDPVVARMLASAYQLRDRLGRSA